MTEEKDAETGIYDTKPVFDPYQTEEAEPDPEAVQPISSPAQSSDPGFGDTSGADGEQQSGSQPGQTPQGQPAPLEELPEFDPKYRDAFVGLLYLGRLTDTFSLWAHKFSIRTTTTEEMAAVALLVKPYAGTNMEDAVFQSAVVAASVTLVDGIPLPSSIEVDDSGDLGFRFEYVMKNWMPPVREEIFNRCFALDVTSREVLRSMGKASG